MFIEFTGVSLLAFQNAFRNNDDCIKYLAEMKWSKGYKCSKCGNDKARTGNLSVNKRCLSCGYEESPTANTLFHKIKFDLIKAFHICYRTSVSKKGMSTTELSRELDLRQKTCWAFKHKTQVAMASSEQYALQGNIEVDEFAVGGQDEAKQGRSKGDKKIIAIAVEKPSSESMGRAYAMKIENYSADEIGKLLNRHISKQGSCIKTDCWTAYEKLSKEWNIKQVKSDKGKNFPQMHILIMNFKTWLRGIHHKCSQKYMQCYLDEFFFRFNRRVFSKTIFHKLINRMVEHKPLYHKQFAT